MEDIQGQEVEQTPEVSEGKKVKEKLSPEELNRRKHEGQLRAKAAREAAGLPFKATAEEHEMRINFIHQLLRTGHTPGQIEQELQKEYLLSKDRCGELIREARQALVAKWDAVSREELAATFMDRFDLAYHKGLELNQVGAAIGALQAQARMVGIDVPGGSYSRKKNKRST